MRYVVERLASGSPIPRAAEDQADLDHGGGSGRTRLPSDVDCQVTDTKASNPLRRIACYADHANARLIAAALNHVADAHGIERAA